jgi:hypothetical protein
MLLAPHGSVDAWTARHCRPRPVSVEGFGPFFSNHGIRAADSGYGCSKLWIGTFLCFGQVGRVMIDMLILQTFFLAVLFAVLVNIIIPWQGIDGKKP